MTLDNRSIDKAEFIARTTAFLRSQTRDLNKIDYGFRRIETVMSELRRFASFDEPDGISIYVSFDILGLRWAMAGRLNMNPEINLKAMKVRALCALIYDLKGMTASEVAEYLNKTYAAEPKK